MSFSVAASRSSAGLFNFLQQRRQDTPALPSTSTTEGTPPATGFQRDTAKLDAGSTSTGRRSALQHTRQVKTDLSALASAALPGVGTAAESPSAVSDQAASTTTSEDPTDLNALLRAVQSGGATDGAADGAVPPAQPGTSDLDALLSAVQSGR